MKKQQQNERTWITVSRTLLEVRESLPCLLKYSEADIEKLPHCSIMYIHAFN